MADPGTRAADAAQAALIRRFRAIYRQAQEEIIEKLNAQNTRMLAMEKVKRAQLESGQITQKQFNDWMNGQIFIGKQWRDKVTSVASTLLDASKQANELIEGQKRAVFAENATYEAYRLEHDAGLDLSFTPYDSATVGRLIMEEPELLPRKVVDGAKADAWNRRGISNAVTQGIIQGETIQQIAKRIAKQTASSDMKAMIRYARTAMTGAQNAGRMEVMHEAQEMGIAVRKKWLATLDKRTRDSHAHLDGQIQDIDMPFKSMLGDIMYPGDPTAAPGNVYNCRCTMEYVYPEYERKEWAGERRDQEGDRLLPNMSYSQWLAYKERESGDTDYRESVDVTDEYQREAKPGEGGLTHDPNYKFSEKQSDEVWFANYLHDTYGGDLQLRQEDDRTETIKYPEYIWRARYWELKEPTTYTAINGRLGTAIKQIAGNPGGVILNLDMDDYDLKTVLNIADKRLGACGFDSDLMIFHRRKLVCIKRYKK